MDDPVIDTILGILSEKFGVDRADLSRETRLIEDLKMDSLDAVEVVMEVEDAIGMSIPDEDAEAIKTVGDLIAYARRRRDEEGGAGVTARLKPKPPDDSPRIPPPS